VGRKQKVLLIILGALAACAYSNCATGRGTGAVVSDLGDGTAEYREIQGDIGEGETALAITGTRIEEGLGELEQSISSSQGIEQEIGDVIQRIRARPVDPTLIEEWRNRRSETGNGGTNSGDGKI